MRVTAKGQVTIPLEIREKLNISPGTEVDFIVEGDDHICLVKREARQTSMRFSRLRGVTTVNMTTEKILALKRQII